MDFTVPRDTHMAAILWSNRHATVSSVHIKNGGLRARRGESNKKIALRKGTPIALECVRVNF